MMASYRIIKHNGMYIPQERILFWWFNYNRRVNRFDNMGDPCDESVTITFVTLKDAEDYLLGKRPIPYEIVREY